MPTGEALSNTSTVARFRTPKVYCQPAGILPHFSTQRFDLRSAPIAEWHMIRGQCACAPHNELPEAAKVMQLLTALDASIYISPIDELQRFFSSTYWSRKSSGALAGHITDVADVARVLSLASRAHYGTESAIDLLANVDHNILLGAVRDERFRRDLVQYDDAAHHIQVLMGAVAKNKSAQAAHKIAALEALFVRGDDDIIEFFVDALVTVCLLQPNVLRDVFNHLTRLKAAFRNRTLISDIILDAFADISELIPRSTTAR